MKIYFLLHNYDKGNTRWMLIIRLDLLTQTQLYFWAPDSTKHIIAQCPGQNPRIASRNS